MLSALGRADGGVKAAADAYLRISPKQGVPLGVEAPDGGEQTQHTLLDQVLAVPSRQKQGAGTGANQLPIAADQFGLRLGVTPGSPQTQIPV